MLHRKTLSDVNQAMLPNTGRSILFTTVNLDPQAPRLEDMLAELTSEKLSWTQFNTKVKNELAVHSFEEFLKKLKPCFFYRLVRGGQIEMKGEGNEVFTIDELPKYEFSLDGGP